MTGGLDYFRILGVPRDATAEEIRTVYFNLARQFHPDANSDPSAREQFLVIQDAYSVLSNPERRADYESRLPPPPPPPDISVKIHYSRSAIPLIGEQQLLYSLVELVCTTEPDRALYPPAHVCLVIDRSTSMQGERMDMVKSNISQMLKILRPQDMVSVVAFGDQADVVIPPSRAVDLASIESRVMLIKTAGGTELFKGLALGLEQLSNVKGLRMVRQLFLLTDGHTYGDEQPCFDLAKRASGNGITISAMGIGHEWNDEFLDRLTSLNGGNTTFVTSSKDVASFLDQKMRALTTLYARRINFDFHGDPKAELRSAFRIYPDIGPLKVESPIPLGDLVYGKALMVLFEFLIPPLALGTQNVSLAEGRLVMEIPSQEGASARIHLKINRSVIIGTEQELPPSELIDAMGHLSLYRLQEKAREEVNAGNVSVATRHLQYLATHLLSQGNRELAHSVLVEAEHIQQNRQFSRDGEKRIKYGTRALLLPSGMEQLKI